MEEPEKPLTDPHFDALMTQLRERFEPATSLEDAGLKLTTQEVFDRLQAFYPSATYSATTVYLALQKLGYRYDDPFRDMSYVWLFK